MPDRPDAPAASETPLEPVPARLPVPAPAEQAKSRKLFKEIFSKELKDRSPSARRVLAAKLLDQSASVNDAPSDRFVLLVGASEAGKEASDLAIFNRAADALADAYDVDGLRIKSDAAMKMTLRADSPTVAADNCVAGLTLADQLVAAGDYITAARLLQSLRSAAPDASLSSQIQNRSKELDSLRAAAKRVAPAVQKLKIAPDDAPANLALGEYLCFIKGDWKRGLPFLAKGGKAALSQAAVLDLAGATDPGKQTDLGNLWWDGAEKEAGPNQSAMRERAASWYEMALQSGNVPGLTRVLIEKRIAAAPPKEDASSLGSRGVLWFANSDPEGIPFKAISHGKVKQVGSDEVAHVLADPNTYAGIQIVVWGVNRWRGTPPDLFTEKAQRALQQFVRDGGDVVIFEQWATEHMDSFDRIFNIRTSGAAGGAKIVLPALMAKVENAGLTEDVLKTVAFYNSYLDLPKGSVVMVRNSEGKDVVAIAPFGKGRLILIGTTTDPTEKRLGDEILDVIYHWKAAKAAQDALERQKSEAHGRSSR